MKIKRPADGSGPSAPRDLGEGKHAEKSNFQKEVEKTAEPRTQSKVRELSGFEKSLTRIAGAMKSEGLGGEAMVNKVVDSVLEEVLGKDFTSRPDSAVLRDAFSPFISQDEVLMNKLNSMLSRMERKK